jgi:hypothetical protein
LPARYGITTDKFSGGLKAVMLGKKEVLFLDSLLSFVKESPRFRPLALDEIADAFGGIDAGKVFLVVKGSYQSHDVVMGMLLNYDISRMDSPGRALGMLYRVYCRPPVEIRFTRETASDRVTKEIGLEIEVQVNNSLIDRSYLIHSNRGDRAAQVANSRPMQEFLERCVQDLEVLDVGPRFLQYVRTLPFDFAGSGWIREDLDQLSAIAASFNGRKEEGNGLGGAEAQRSIDDPEPDASTEA